jgi:hypothetical protein
MPRYFIRGLALAAFFAAGTSANAALISLTGNLTPFEENPTPQAVGAGATAIGPAVGQQKFFDVGPNALPPALTGIQRDTSFGVAEFQLDTTPGLEVLRMRVTINNIDVTGTQTPGVNDNLTAAHIHAGPTAVPGQTAAGVVWGFFGTPFNDSDGDVTFTPNPSGVGGTFQGEWDRNEGNGAANLLPFHIDNILNGRSYINFHTQQFQGGEIRSQLRVPEPGTMALLGLALLGVGFARRRGRN